MNSSPTLSDAEGLLQTYTPGYGGLKLLSAAFGLVLFILGMTQLWTPLRLLAFGERVMAEATTVAKVKAGFPDRILRDDLEIQADLEPRDRSYVFWNEFRFQTKEDKVVEVRAPVGSQLKPLYPLLDGDGLPTTDLVCYDPAYPQTVVFPWLISTWFASGVLVVTGVVCIIVGLTLFYWSDKPIEIPHMPARQNT